MAKLLDFELERITARIREVDERTGHKSSSEFVLGLAVEHFLNTIKTIDNHLDQLEALVNEEKNRTRELS